MSVTLAVSVPGLATSTQVSNPPRVAPSARYQVSAAAVTPTEPWAHRRAVGGNDDTCRAPAEPRAPAIANSPATSIDVKENMIDRHLNW